MEILEPISRRNFLAQELVEQFPARVPNANKRIVFNISCPAGGVHSGEISFSRWGKMTLPLQLDTTQTELVPRPDYFGYEPSVLGEIDWYLNFSHSHLFCAYGGGLFAQDEMQVAEHPALGSLLEALLPTDIKPLTVENRQPTPILIAGVERRVRVEINPDAAQGRPNGLYGNQFSRAKPDVIERATKVLNPPTKTNLIAMEAPEGGDGPYLRDEIEYILATAYTGFTAARLESHQFSSMNPRVVVHTGYWGYGAYGGNRSLMASLQILAAHLAGLDRLVFHAGDANGVKLFQDSLQMLHEKLGLGESVMATSQLIDRLDAMGFRWGTSDGN